MTKPVFCRYTTLPILIDILSNKRLTLLDPKNWDDKNDSYFIELYKQKKELRSVLALCFADAAETYHHWKVFSGNESGVRIVFDKDKILSVFNKKGYVKDYVNYLFIKELEKGKTQLSDLPFLKRQVFRDENEYRVIYEDKVQEISSKNVTIHLDSILEIVVNPWMPKTVFTSVRKNLKSIDGCKHIKIHQTTIVENEKWKKLGSNINI